MFFRFYQAKVLDCVFCARRSALRAVGWKKIILASLRYFFRQALPQKTANPRNGRL